MRFVHVLDSALPRRRWVHIGEPKGNPVGEVLPHLGEGVLHLGEPKTAAKCYISCCTVFCVGWLFGRAPNTKGPLSGYVKL